MLDETFSLALNLGALQAATKPLVRLNAVWAGAPFGPLLPGTKCSSPVRTTHILAAWGHQQFVSQTNENIYTAGAQTWTPQKENNAEWSGSFILKQTHFSVNNDKQQH
jgi:hypothetical protein